MGGIQRYGSASVYHMMPSLIGKDAMSCWHCCEEIKDVKTCVPLPRVYDNVEKIYHVYGCTCSPSCAKAYILEHTTFDRGQHMNVLTKMLREVYNVSGDVKIAPPRCSLKRFGGVFDPNSSPKANCTLLHPPFVSYCMLVEERTVSQADNHVFTNFLSDLPTAEEADTLEEPHPPGLYNDFLKKMDTGEEKESGNAALDSAGKSTKRRRSDSGGKAAASGPLSRFVKPN